MRAQPAVSMLLIAGVVMVGAAPQAHSQDRQRRTFNDTVEVRVINLEAVIVDRQGNRVPGLEPADFALQVDGKSVPIEYFSEIVDGLSVESAAGPTAELPGAAPVVGSPGGRVATSYLVFIDSYFTKLAARRNIILSDIEDNLARLGPEDRMAIVAFDGRKLKVLASWSQSAGELRRALAEARDLPARGNITSALADEVDRAIDQEGQVAAAVAARRADLGEAEPTGMVRDDGMPSDICASIARLERRVARAVTGVTATLRSFARPPGRKVMMVLSGGWPQSAKDYLVGTNPFGAMECRAQGPAIYHPIYETANRLGYTLYPVDVPPVDTTGEEEFTRGFEIHSTLLRIAEETGGSAMIDGASDSAFERLVDDTRTYYWLGFTPEWKGDDEKHDVKLEVLKPGLEMRTRSGYTDMSRQTEISFVTESALLFGDLPGSLPLGLDLGVMPEKGRGKLSVPVQLTIPMDAIVMMPENGRYVADLELRIGVVDESGNRNDMPVIPVVLEGNEPPPPGAHAVYETTIKIRRRPHDIVVSLYDPLSETILAATDTISPEE